MTLKELVLRCKKNDRKAQRKLFEILIHEAMNVSRRYLKNFESANDATAVGFTKVFENIQRHEFINERSFKSWVFKIIVNECLMTIRREKANLFSSLEEYTEYPQDAHESDIDHEYILEAIDELPDGFRLIFNLYAIEGYSHKEIADKLQISESTSRSQFYHAKKKLQDKLRTSYGI